MAKLAGGLQFTGTIDDISVYKPWNSDKLIVRKKGGPSKEKIKTGAAFSVTRRYQGEFGSRSKAGSLINKTLHQLKPVVSINVCSRMITLLQPAQEDDKVNPLGQRSILLSKRPELLDGINLNHRNPFESILSAPLTSTASREDLVVSVKLPAITPGINFYPIGTFPVYRVVIVAGIIPDFHFDETKGYCHYYPEEVLFPVNYIGGWNSVHEAATAKTVDLSLPYSIEREDHSILVAAGISFGLIRGAGNYEVIRGAGCGKVIGDQLSNI